MNDVRTSMDPVRRARLALKGRLLYGKYCGTKGQATCAEGFAVYHLQRGEIEVVRDYLHYLESQLLLLLQQTDPCICVDMTEALVVRIRKHLIVAEMGGGILRE